MLYPITEFTVIRHGRTEANALNIIQGQSNTRLDDLGRKQAACAAERLKNKSFDILFCSDLDRTKDTAAILLTKTHASEIHYTPELREWDLGELVGEPVKLAREKYPAVFNGREKEGENIRILKGESRRDLYLRTTRFLEWAAENHAGKKILLVTHAGPLRAMFRYVAGEVIPQALTPRVDNVSLSRFQKKDGLWQLLTWNDTAHLESAGSSDSIAP
ncbi:MAG: histidine phosphatase family protein [Lentisphaeria bacterium]|nr:histidine phosphatase family protein [Lentisphaeria bacterium]